MLVELRAASLNHLDLWLRKGLPSVPKPRILGADGAGVIAGTDERVVINPALAHDGGVEVLGEHRDGTHAELIAVPRSAVHPIPAGLSFEQAAAFPLVFETAYRMLVTKARLEPGEWVLIWGIGSGVATAALAIAKALGARTIVTSSSDAKLEQARELGADETLNHDTDDVPARVRELTGGGAARRRRARRRGDLAALARLGRVATARIVVCGATSGPNPPAALNRVWWRELTIFGSTMGTPADFQGAYDLDRLRPSAARRRLGLPARRGRGRPRAPRARRAARQDRLANPASRVEAAHERRARVEDRRASRRARRAKPTCCGRGECDQPAVRVRPAAVRERPPGRIVARRHRVLPDSRSDRSRPRPRSG